MFFGVNVVHVRETVVPKNTPDPFRDRCQLCLYSMTSERQFIHNLQQQFPARAPVLVGIGDDGAVLDTSCSDRQVIVADMLLDGVHFDLAKTSPELAGRKAIAVNLSDLAAMACQPETAFVSLAVSRQTAGSETFLDQLYAGIRDIAQQYGVVVAGGDTNVWDGPFAISVTMTGTPFGDEVVLRSGARPGDRLLVTGPLGGSLESGRHLSFEPRLEVARWLIENADVRAMLDISDGLAIDLHRMMEASGTGAVLFQKQIPVHADIVDAEDPVQRSLSDGEDFELLVAVSDDSRDSVWTAFADRPLYEIGVVTGDAGSVVMESANDRTVSLQADGWQHL